MSVQPNRSRKKQQKIAYELAVALEEAKEANEAKQSFLSKMSYDIRRPGQCEGYSEYTERK